jgi:hypothetical protein
MNANRYLRIGFGRHAGYKVFRLAGTVVKWLLDEDHWDIWRMGPW